MTLPSPDDREAVANWIDSFGLMDDHANDIKPDHPIVRAIQRLIRATIEAQEARIAAVLAAVDDIDERIRADGSALRLWEIFPLLDAARALRRTT